jgi:hypothetical protein
MTSGIKSLRRIDGVDVDGRRVAVLIGYTSGGRVVVGIASAGRDRADFAFLNADAGTQFLAGTRAAVMGAAGASS